MANLKHTSKRASRFQKDFRELRRISSRLAEQGYWFAAPRGRSSTAMARYALRDILIEDTYGQQNRVGQPRKRDVLTRGMARPRFTSSSDVSEQNKDTVMEEDSGHDEASVESRSQVNPRVPDVQDDILDVPSGSDAPILPAESGEQATEGPSSILEDELNDPFPSFLYGQPVGVVQNRVNENEDPYDLLEDLLEAAKVGDENSGQNDSQVSLPHHRSPQWDPLRGSGSSNGSKEAQVGVHKDSFVIYDDSWNTENDPAQIPAHRSPRTPLSEIPVPDAEEKTEWARTGALRDDDTDPGDEDLTHPGPQDQLGGQQDGIQPNISTHSLDENQSRGDGTLSVHSGPSEVTEPYSATLATGAMRDPFAILGGRARYEQARQQAQSRQQGNSPQQTVISEGRPLDSQDETELDETNDAVNESDGAQDVIMQDDTENSDLDGVLDGEDSDSEWENDDKENEAFVGRHLPRHAGSQLPAVIGGANPSGLPIGRLTLTDLEDEDPRRITIWRNRWD